MNLRSSRWFTQKPKCYQKTGLSILKRPNFITSAQKDKNNLKMDDLWITSKVAVKNYIMHSLCGEISQMKRDHPLCGSISFQSVFKFMSDPFKNSSDI